MLPIAGAMIAMTICASSSTSTTTSAMIVTSAGLRPAKPSTTQSSPASSAAPTSTIVKPQDHAQHLVGREVHQHARGAVGHRDHPGETAVGGDRGDDRRIGDRERDALAVREVDRLRGVEGRRREELLPRSWPGAAEPRRRSRRRPRHPSRANGPIDVRRSAVRWPPTPESRRRDRGPAHGCRCPTSRRPPHPGRRTAVITSLADHVEPRDRDVTREPARPLRPPAPGRRNGGRRP